jgi:hypothetical protein
VTSGFGFNLAGTYNQTARDYKRYPATWLAPTSDPTTRAAILALPKRTEITTDRAFRTTAFTYIRQHPTYVGEVVFWNTVRLFDMQGPDHALFITQRLYPPRLTRISVYASYVVDAFALGALFLASVRRSPKAFWVFPVTAGVGLVLVSANIRYRASIEPFLVLLAAAAIAGLLERIPRRSWPDRSG